MSKNAIISGIIILLIFGTFVVLKCARNKKYFYKFYTDKFTCSNRFFSNKIKEIRYENIKDIRYSQGFLQSKFNLGEIYIETKHTPVFMKITALKNVPNVKKNFEKISEIVNPK